MVHLYCWNITGADYNALYAKASPARQTRAAGYLQREDSLRCLAGEALLRYALRQALGMTAFTLEADPQGKPRVVEAEGFHFNLSHSGPWVVLAWGDSPVGVDVERPRPQAKTEALARRFFTPEEQDYVLCRQEGREQRFLEIWTGKESYLKYLGTGLQRPLASFNVLALAEKRHTMVLEDGSVVTLCCRDGDILPESVITEQL